MDSLVVVAVVAFVAVAVFLIGRQFVLWYFRINQIADDLHVIADHYRAQAMASKATNSPTPIADHYKAQAAKSSPKPQAPAPTLDELKSRPLPDWYHGELRQQKNQSS